MNKKSFSLLFSLIIFLNAFLLVFYLFQVEKIIKQNYLAEAYKEKTADLKEQNLALEQKTMESFSLGNIEKEIKTLGFVEISKIKYIPISYDYLAKGSMR